MYIVKHFKEWNLSPVPVLFRKKNRLNVRFVAHCFCCALLARPLSYTPAHAPFHKNVI